MPYCGRDRLIACQRVGMILRTKEEVELGNKFLTRACDGRIQFACDAIKEQDDRWSLICTLHWQVFFFRFYFCSNAFQEQSEMQTTEQLEEGATEKKDEMAQTWHYPEIFKAIF